MSLTTFLANRWRVDDEQLLGSEPDVIAAVSYGVRPNGHLTRENFFICDTVNALRRQYRNFVLAYGVYTHSDSQAESEQRRRFFQEPNAVYAGTVESTIEEA